MAANVYDFGLPIREGFGGSWSYGTAIPEKSDKDKRGIFIPHRKFLVSTQRVDEFNDPNEEDTVWFALQKFVNLALEGNPNVIEQLFIRPQEVIFENEFGKELFDLRYEFLTKNTYGRFGGYAYAQLKKINNKNNSNHHGSHKDLIDMYGYDTKHAMHLIRLFQMGKEILTEGELRTYRPNAKELLEIRHGKYTLKEIHELANQLEQELEEAMVNSKIPEYPNFDKINKWVINVTDRAHSVGTHRGVFQGVQFNILPLEYEMIDKCSVLLVANKLQRKEDKSDAIGIVIPYKDWYIGLRTFEPFKFENTTIYEIRHVVSMAKSAEPKIIDMIFASDKQVLYKHSMADELKEKLKSMITKTSLFNKIDRFVDGNIKAMKNWERAKEEWNKQRECAKKNMSEYPPVPKNTDTKNSSVMYKFGYDTLKAVDVYHSLLIGIELLKTGNVVNSRAYESELYAIKHGKYKTFKEFSDVVDNLMIELNEAIENSPLPEKNNDKEIEEWMVDYIVRYHETI